MAEITFGECLSLLLSALDMSANRLSRAINVDGSLTSRWIRGERIPSYRSNYIEDISNYLSRNILHSLQHQEVDRLCLEVFGEIQPEDGMKDKIRKLLLEAQGYSLESRKSREKKKNASRRPVSVPYTSLSAENKVVMGRQQVASIALALIEAAAGRKAGGQDIIRLSFLHDTGLFSTKMDLTKLGTLLMKAIDNGWSVVCLLRLDRNMERLVRMVEFAAPLARTGQLAPFCLKGYDAANMGREILIVPGEGALSCFTTNGAGEIDSCFYMQDQVAVDIFSGHFNTLLTTGAQAMIRYYAEAQSTEYAQRMVECEQAAGKRFMIRDEFGMLTLPDSLFEKLCRTCLPTSSLRPAMEFRRERMNAFWNNLKLFEHKDIYTFEAIEEWIRSRKYQFLGNHGMQTVILETQDLIEHLKHIIFLLEKYDNYHIALAHQSGERPDRRHYIIMKERQAILLGSWQSRKMPEVRSVIREPMVIHAFEQYFMDQWKQIAPINREKGSIIRFLQAKLHALEQDPHQAKRA